jgi:hypothetical protein
MSLERFVELKQKPNGAIEKTYKSLANTIDHHKDIKDHSERQDSTHD